MRVDAMHGRGPATVVVPFQEMALLRRATSDDALDSYRVMVTASQEKGKEGKGVTNKGIRDRSDFDEYNR